MTREEAIKWLKFDLKQWERDCKSVHPTKEALDMAIKSLEAEPCEDAVSREEALKVMCDKCPMYNCVTGCSSYRYIEKLPSVTPTRPKGEWILDDGLRRIHKCSNCGQLIMTDDIDVYNYCHGCGADMRRGDADERTDEPV